MEMNIRLGARLFFGVVFLTYLLATVLLYFYGPWTYAMEGGTGPLVSFLIASHVAFAVGYFAGVRGRAHAGCLPTHIETVVVMAALLELVLLFPTSVFTTGNWVPDPVGAAQDLGGEYTRSLQR